MLTAVLTASICPFSLFLLCSDNGVEGTGVLCVEKVDLIACDSREEPPFFSRRAWRAISSSLILAWRVIMGGLSQQNPSMALLVHAHVRMFFNLNRICTIYSYYTCVCFWFYSIVSF